MKGIILAGGSGSRLHPLTIAVSKQMLPIYSKPMIYYPLSTLMLAGIKDVLVISTPDDLGGFRRLLGDGSKWGMNLSYVEQPSPDGLAQAFILGKEFIGNDSVSLVLGDNIFYGSDLQNIVRRGSELKSGGKVFGCWVKDPERYGVAEFDEQGTVVGIEEKPEVAKSNYAVTGLYFYDNDVVNIAANIKPSPRGELEITDVNVAYLKEKKLTIELFGRGIAWLDTGTHQSLVDASNFVKAVEDRQGMLVSSPEEIAWRNGFIDSEQLVALAEPLLKTQYGQYLRRLVRGE